MWIVPFVCKEWFQASVFAGNSGLWRGGWVFQAGFVLCCPTGASTSLLALLELCNNGAKHRDVCGGSPWWPAFCFYTFS